MNSRFTKFAGTAVAATGLGLAALATAGTASAASVDDAFLADIRSAGIVYDSPQGAIANAHAVCHALADGHSGVDVGNVILANTNLTSRQVAVFVVDSVDAYCPRYATLLV